MNHSAPTRRSSALGRGPGHADSLLRRALGHHWEPEAGLGLRRARLQLIRGDTALDLHLIDGIARLGGDDAVDVVPRPGAEELLHPHPDRKSTRLNSSP